MKTYVNKYWEDLKVLLVVWNDPFLVIRQNNDRPSNMPAS